MKEDLLPHIPIKIAITLAKLLEASKQSPPTIIHNEEVADSYNKIALNAGVRKATVSDSFNAKSDIQSSTLILIIKGMGYKLEDFAKLYDSIEDKEVQEFEKTKRL